MGLEEYKRKRRFTRTPEPPGGRPKRRRAKRLAFVVQKHRASHLHYDFRLEWNGVLLSWAVPRGPSVDPSVKRLAMQVEDHPLEYARFEGIIPAGEYGGGTVMVWDRGTWTPEVPDVDRALERGDLKFTLHGEKLRGSWVLVRTRGRDGARPQWLLIKHRDDAASDEDVTETRPRSVVSDRLLAEIAWQEGGDVARAASGDPVDEIRALAAAPERAGRPRRRPSVWHSNRKSDGKSDGSRAAPRTARGKAAEPAAPREEAPKPSGARGKGGRTRRTQAAKGTRSRARSGDRTAAQPAAETSFGVRVTNPDKVFWPDEGYTKLDLVRYYDRIFPQLQPWMKDRLISLKRCPNGLLGKCFFQKEKPETMPADTPTKRIVHENGVRNYVVGGRKETQLALVNLGCIAVHVWGARAATPRQPDWVCFDLDPDSGRFADAARAGLLVKEVLDAVGLVSFPKTSGKKGMHIFVPIRVGPDADEVRDFAAHVGHLLANAYPDEITMEFRLARRRGRVYVDAARNGFAQTVAAPWSVRRFPGATVSTPLAWSEVKPSLDPGRFTMKTVFARLRRKDPWDGFFALRQPLAKAIRAVERA